MSDFIAPFNPTLAASGTFPVLLPNGGWLFIHNLSPVEMSFQVGIMAAPVLVPAYVARCFKIKRAANQAAWQNLGTVQSPGQGQTFFVYGEAYATDEWTGGEMYIALSRQVNVGNTVSTNATPAIVNDGNAPATQIIESTPSDQSASAEKWNNDASGTEQILSANVQRIVRKNTRGNSGTGKAVVQFGDSGDASITTFNGSIQGGQPANVGAITLPSGNGISVDGTAGALVLQAQLSSANPKGIYTQVWDGANIKNVLSLGGQYANAPAWFDTAGNLAGVAGNATAGRGVALEKALMFNVAVTNTSATTIVSTTSPGSNALARVTCIFFIGSSNTNNGTITLQVNYFDPFTGLSTSALMYQQGNGAISASSLLKGTQYDAVSLARQCSTGTNVQVVYTNGAAGTISDKVTAVIEFLG